MVKPKNLLNILCAALSQIVILTGVFYILSGFSGCEYKSDGNEPPVVWDTLTVTASAFNSLNYQTGLGNPNLTAWGDTIEPGMKVLAVSRDLIAKGLDHNTEVIIEGMEGVFVVKDKMHYRWKNKIDIYMDEDVGKAREFGRKKLKIYYEVPIDSISKNKNSKNNSE